MTTKSLDGKQEYSESDIYHINSHFCKGCDEYFEDYNFYDAGYCFKCRRLHMQQHRYILKTLRGNGN